MTFTKSILNSDSKVYVTTFCHINDEHPNSVYSVKYTMQPGLMLLNNSVSM